MESSRKIITSSNKHKQLSMNNIQLSNKRPNVADFTIKSTPKIKTTSLPVNPYHEAVLDDTILIEYLSNLSY
jgi:hypothetical protein